VGDTIQNKMFVVCSQKEKRRRRNIIKYMECQYCW